MKKINYVDIFKSAFVVAWENKFLWFFGFFLVIGTSLINYNVDTKKIFQSMPSFETPSWFSSPFLIVTVAVIIGVAFIFLYVMRILSSAAIIKSSNDIAVYKNSSVFSLLKEVKSSFWTLFLIEVLLSILLGMIFLVMLSPIIILFTLKAIIMGILAALLGLGIFIPLAILTFFLLTYSFIFAVVGKNKVSRSIEMAYDLFKNNIKESLVMGLFSLLIALVYWAAVLSAAFMVVIILGIFCGILFLASKIAAMVLVAMLALALLISLVVVASFAQVFSRVAWVLFFQKIAFTKEKEKATEEPAIVLENVPDPGTV
jgi:hypothetical protein